MRDFALVFKILLRNQNAPKYTKKGRRRLPDALMLAVVMLIMSLFLSFTGFVLMTDVNTLSQFSFVVSAIVSAAQLLGVFMFAFNVTNALYASGDRALLNSLPLRPTAVFFAKLALVYVDMLLAFTALLLPLLTVFGAVFAATSKTMFYAFFALIPFICVLSPLLPLFLISLLSLPIVWISTFLKGKNILKTILALLFYMAIMTAYFVLIYYGDYRDDADNVETLSALLAIGKAMYPNLVLARLCLGIEAGKSFGITVAIIVGMIGLILLISALFYKSISRRNIEARADGRKMKYKLTASKPIASLVKKDLRSILRTNLLLSPILIVILYFSVIAKISAEPEIEEGVTSYLALGLFAMMTSIFTMSANLLANLAYTREGKAFYLQKTLPVSAKQSIIAKLIIALVFPECVLITDAILCGTLYRADAWGIALLTLCMAIAIVGFAALHIFCDIVGGNVNWTTAQELRTATNYKKGTLSITIGAVMYGVLIFIGFLLLGLFDKKLSGAMSIGMRAIVYSASFMVAAAICGLGIGLLFGEGVKRYEKIGENKLTYKNPTIKLRRGRNGLFGR